MKAANYQTVKEEKVADPAAKDCFIRVLIGPADGAGKFHMRRFRVLPGGYTPLHTHDWEHEVFILAGAGELATADGPRPFAAGHVIFVAPQELHQFKNTGPADLEFLCLIPATGPA
jgi:quercetin dioxygenase-like cupin family protein